MDRRARFSFTLFAAAAAALLPAAALALHPERKELKDRSEFCRQNPNECTNVTEERRAQLKEWCENNPVDCDEERQALMELHREKLRKARRAKHEIRSAAVETGRRAPRREEPKAQERETRTGPPR